MYISCLPLPVCICTYTSSHCFFSLLFYNDMYRCPPEVLAPGATAESYTAASDVFSLSFVMAEILFRILPLDYIASSWDYEVWYRSLTVTGLRPGIWNECESECEYECEMNMNVNMK